jgi:ubiquinone/menaquinone biosynthesis C-methylase UbiE
MKDDDSSPHIKRVISRFLFTFPLIVTLIYIIARLVRRYNKSPTPFPITTYIDNPLRRMLLPPDEVALRHGIRKGMKVLEIGPGNGSFTFAAARRVGNNGRVAAVDIQTEVIERIQRKARVEGYQNIEARVLDVHDLPYAEGTFDVISMTMVFGEIPQPQKALQEFHRLLSANGKLVFSEYIVDPDYQLSSKLIEQCNAAGFRLVRKMNRAFGYTAVFDKHPELRTGRPISRVNRPRLAARENYNRIGKWYDLLAGSSEHQFIDLGIDMLQVKPGEHILEIGFGTGYSIISLAQAAGDTGKIHGIDISDRMLEISKEKVNAERYGQRVELVQGDALSLPYEDKSMDSVFISFTLELFDNPEMPHVLDECTRVLKDEGRLGLVAMAKTHRDTFSVRLYEWAHKRFPNAVDCRPIYVRDTLREAGWQVVDITHTSTWGLPVDIVLAKKLLP